MQDKAATHLINSLQRQYLTSASYLFWWVFAGHLNVFGLFGFPRWAWG
jgi:hypothetical protein